MSNNKHKKNTTMLGLNSTGLNVRVGKVKDDITLAPTLGTNNENIVEENKDTSQNKENPVASEQSDKLNVENENAGNTTIEESNPTDDLTIVVTPVPKKEAHPVLKSTSYALLKDSDDTLQTALKLRHQSANSFLQEVILKAFSKDGKLLLDIPVQPKRVTINRSIALPENIKNAITKEANHRNMTAGELVSKIIDKLIVINNQ